VEALVRAGIGRFILIDFDTVGPSNLNRQLLATLPNIGKGKALLMQERILSINDQAQVICHQEFMDAQNRAELTRGADYVIVGIHSLDCHYFSSFREIKHYDLSFPRVFKTINGSNSTGVALVNSQKDIQKELRKHQKSLSWGQKLDFWRRKHLRKHKHFPGYPDYDLLKDAREYQDYMSPEIPFVLQEFIPGLSYDYRVIVLGERYFISKRHTKAGDFRASGAKLFDFELSDVDRILDYAQELYAILGSPFISLDFGEDAAGKLYLFEYQASHFGINAIVRGSGYYLQQSGKWQFVKQPPQFERYLAQALAHYLEP
jgi:hypothetical protein